MESALPKNLKKLRQSLALNQTEMAVKLEISQSYYAAIEKGSKGITEKNAKAISAKVSTAFNLPVDWQQPKLESNKNYNYCPNCGHCLK